MNGTTPICRYCNMSDPGKYGIVDERHVAVGDCIQALLAENGRLKTRTEDLGQELKLMREREHDRMTAQKEGPS